MPKCGSSALQTYFSSSEFQTRLGDRVGYACIYNDGKVLHGRELIEASTRSPHGYLSSHNAELVTKLDRPLAARIRSQLRDLGKDYSTLLLSSESWGPNPQVFDDGCIFADPNFDVSVVTFVRPQVEWMNSAWWQWGAWTKALPPRWINMNRRKAEWAALIAQWRDKPWVNEVTTCLLSNDVVGQIQGYFGVDHTSFDIVNQGMPEILLRLFQHHRELRPGPHDSSIEFALRRHLDLPAEPTPWVIGPKMVQALLAHYQADNERLADYLSAEDAAAMRDDPRWWSAEPYQSKRLRPAETPRIPAEALESLAIETIQSIARMDAEIRRLRSKLANDTPRAPPWWKP
jgi:hypothetical protein